MKTTSLILGLILTAIPAFADQADDFYRQGVQLMQRGEVEKAETALMKALELRPGHPYARHQLGKLRASKGQLKAKQRELKLTAVKMPSVEIADATLSEAIEYMNMQVEELSAKENGKENTFFPNIMVQDPKKLFENKEVNLRLRGIPASEVLELMMQQVGGIVRFDEHAIVILPAGQAGGQ